MTPTRRALLIGINAYTKVSPLEGCVNDATLMHDLLRETFRFAPEHVTLLTDAAATRAGILGALNDLLGATQAGDVVVVYFAGHGSQMRADESGRNEASGRDNTLMPVDTGYYESDPNLDITDDEIHTWLRDITEATRFVTLIVDACHSATITRDAAPRADVRARGIPLGARGSAEGRTARVPADLERRSRRGAAGQALAEKGPSGWLPVDDRYVLIAGCRDEERSLESDVVNGSTVERHGALTWNLVQELRRAGDARSYRDVFEQASARVTADHPTQHPQMEGMVDRAVFGVTDLVPMRYHLVDARDDAGVTLAAGRVHGIAVGTLLDVYPAEAKTEAGGAIGTLEVTAVDATTSTAAVRSEREPGVVAQHARAVQRTYGHRLAVWLAPEVGSAADAGDAAARGLRDLLASHALLELVPGETAAAARVRLADGMWTVIDPSGALLMKQHPAGKFDVIVNNLEKWSRRKTALALENSDPDSRLAGAVTLDLLRLGPDGTWYGAEPDAAGGMTVFEVGEPIAFRLTSTHAAPLHVHLFSFDPDGAIDLLFPPAGGTDALAPDAGPLEIGSPDVGDPWRALYPKGFPFDREGGAGDAESTLKVFVTTQEVRLTGLGQPAMRGAEPAAAGTPNALQEFVLGAFRAGPATRGFGHDTPPTAMGDWTTVTRTVVIRPVGANVPEGGQRVALGGGVSLGASGIATSAMVHDRRSTRALPTGDAADALAQAIAAADATVVKTIALGEAKLAAGARGAGAGAAPSVELEIDAPPPDHAQLVVRTDALGRVTFHFPAAAEAGAREASPGASARVRYAIPVTAVPAPLAAKGARSAAPQAVPLWKGAKELLQVVAFKVAGPVIAEGAKALAGLWESQVRPYEVRAWTAAGRAASAPALDAAGWARLTQGPALLLLHGAFGRTESAFGGMRDDLALALEARYGGRIAGFDHFTLSDDPGQNARRLVTRFVEGSPAGAALTLDVLAEGRGGLVARALAAGDWSDLLGGRTLRVHAVVLAGTPNGGTRLADIDHLATLAGVAATAVNKGVAVLATPLAAATLASAIVVAKIIAAGAAKGLAGLTAMSPDGEYLRTLGSAGGAARYYAVASNFEPRAGALGALATDLAADRFFAGAANDLMVPVASVTGTALPLAASLELAPEDAVPHGGYFANARAAARVLEWLGAAAGASSSASLPAPAPNVGAPAAG